MKIDDIVCKFIEGATDGSLSEETGKIDEQSAPAEENLSTNSLSRRDGMSLESAKLAIGRCANNSRYEIHGIENQGRYFTAKVMDSKGRQVNELLVDKLNGTVKFLR